jgi:hypothetical protein
MRAIYFDSEGHVIHYSVKVSSPNTVTFESDPAQPGPKYRLVYQSVNRSLNGNSKSLNPGKQNTKLISAGPLCVSEASASR